MQWKGLRFIRTPALADKSWGARGLERPKEEFFEGDFTGIYGDQGLLSHRNQDSPAVWIPNTNGGERASLFPSLWTLSLPARSNHACKLFLIDRLTKEFNEVCKPCAGTLNNPENPNCIKR